MATSRSTGGRSWSVGVVTESFFSRADVLSRRTSARSTVFRMVGETILLTGATSGIGRAAALALAPRTRRLLVHGPEPAGHARPRRPRPPPRLLAGRRLRAGEAGTGHPQLLAGQPRRPRRRGRQRAPRCR